MEVRPKRKVLAALVSIGAFVVAHAAPASAAYVRDNQYFDDQGQTCIQGINSTTPVAGPAFEFRSTTDSYNLDCTTNRSLPAGYISTLTGVRSINATTGVRNTCFWDPIHYNSTTSSQSNAPVLSVSDAFVRTYCGISPGDFAAVGATSQHGAVIWGTWIQTGSVAGTVSNVA